MAPSLAKIGQSVAKISHLTRCGAIDFEVNGFEWYEQGPESIYCTKLGSDTSKRCKDITFDQMWHYRV